MDNERSSDLVQPGLLVVVEIKYEVESDRLAFVIVPDDQADFASGFLGECTPLAKAILGEAVGATIPYFVGDAVSVKIQSIEKTDLSPAQDSTAQREQKLQAVVEQVERTNAMIFASSFSGKWGDYDPKGIEAWDLIGPDTPSSSD